MGMRCGIWEEGQIRQAFVQVRLDDNSFYRLHRRREVLETPFCSIQLLTGVSLLPRILKTTQVRAFVLFPHEISDVLLDLFRQLELKLPTLVHGCYSHDATVQFVLVKVFKGLRHDLRRLELHVGVAEEVRRRLVATEPDASNRSTRAQPISEFLLRCLERHIGDEGSPRVRHLRPPRPPCRLLRRPRGRRCAKGVAGRDPCGRVTCDGARLRRRGLGRVRIGGDVSPERSVHRCGHRCGRRCRRNRSGLGGLCRGRRSRGGACHDT
mmetsp:Transcript_92736/g.241942  ORF Transcript_92736/g.241942 Transcript_92736/m.241942 type:complete len:267 (+) Transcript_92736:501-1301(+)